MSVGTQNRNDHRLEKRMDRVFAGIGWMRMALGAVNLLDAYLKSEE